MPYEIKFVCSKCGTKFIGTKLEYGSKCLVCKIGYLVEDKFVEAGINDIYEAENPMIPELPEHPNCSCTGCEFISECTDGIWQDEEIGFIQQTISFVDLDEHEVSLLGLPFDNPLENVPIYNCVTEMNERFLHTFIDNAIVPAGTRNQ